MARAHGDPTSVLLRIALGDQRIGRCGFVVLGLAAELLAQLYFTDGGPISVTGVSFDAGVPTPFSEGWMVNGDDDKNLASPLPGSSSSTRPE